MLFLFVPETFWDRAPVPKNRNPSKRPSFLRRLSSRPNTIQIQHTRPTPASSTPAPDQQAPVANERNQVAHKKGKYVHVGFVPGFDPETREGTEGRNSIEEHTIATGGDHHQHKNLHVGFTPVSSLEAQAEGETSPTLNFTGVSTHTRQSLEHQGTHSPGLEPVSSGKIAKTTIPANAGEIEQSSTTAPLTPNLHNFNSPYYQRGFPQVPDLDNEKIPVSKLMAPPKTQMYTNALRHRPAKSFAQQLKPYHGRLNHDKWFKVMLRPFVLFSYPAVLWSAAVYSCSVGWLIVISESMAMIYRDKHLYNFNALQTGLVYISPFVGGILGTAVAGKVSDIIVKAMARRNGGLYEPEFRLIMAGPMLVSTVIGLMGFGWSAEERDHWIVPTIFFGIISFGCSLGSTTSITFCVDSYRQYAGEALVTLNFSKNIFHGLVFSLFVTHWLTHDGPKTVFLWMGVIQLILLVFTIPMYIYGKRARMWTVRKNFMEKF
jgi:hypothetical protein